MSRYLSSRFADLVPYVAGEQPATLADKIKLNTNENPFPPSPRALAYAADAAKTLQLYNDTRCVKLKDALARCYQVEPEQILCANGSDEALDLCFQAFCDENQPALFPDITYGFYKVVAAADRVPYTEIPLAEDMRIRLSDYEGQKGTIFLANPNAPTGIALPRDEIEALIASRPDQVVVVDEAYIDFGGESCVPLVNRYPNLVVTMTFSKSRSMAGARLGFAIASRELIADLETLRNSRNPYNVNAMTQAAGLGTLEDAEYTRANVRTICQNREFLTTELVNRGFEVLPSSANFVFAAHPGVDGAALYQRLKEKNIFIRHFSAQRLNRYNRITVGTRAQIQTLLAVIDDIMGVGK